MTIFSMHSLAPVRQHEVFSVPPQTQEKGISTIAKKSLFDNVFVAFQPSKEFDFFGPLPADSALVLALYGSRGILGTTVIGCKLLSTVFSLAACIDWKIFFVLPWRIAASSTWIARRAWNASKLTTTSFRRSSEFCAQRAISPVRVLRTERRLEH